MKVKLTCSVCGKGFERHKSHIKSHNYFCSNDCSYKGRSLGLVNRIVVKPYNCYRKGNAEPRMCLYCKVEYRSWKKSQKYCSVKCCDEHKKETLLGENNPSWLDGRSYNKRCYRGNDWEQIRLRIYERDNYSCVECGVKCVSKKSSNEDNVMKIIQCHHIENYGINKNNDDNNLETLCLGCHTKKHQLKNDKK